MESSGSFPRQTANSPFTPENPPFFFSRPARPRLFPPGHSLLQIFRLSYSASLRDRRFSRQNESNIYALFSSLTGAAFPQFPFPPCASLFSNLFLSPSPPISSCWGIEVISLTCFPLSDSPFPPRTPYSRDNPPLLFFYFVMFGSTHASCLRTGLTLQYPSTMQRIPPFSC